MRTLKLRKVRGPRRTLKFTEKVVQREEARTVSRKIRGEKPEFRGQKSHFKVVDVFTEFLCQISFDQGSQDGIKRYEKNQKNHVPVVRTKFHELFSHYFT